MSYLLNKVGSRVQTLHRYLPAQGRAECLPADTEWPRSRIETRVGTECLRQQS